MPGSTNDLSGGVPEWFRLSDAELGGTDFGRLILLVLCRLDSAFPERADISSCVTPKEKISEFNQIWNWLEAQKIVSGSISNCSLTLVGRRSYQEALELAPDSTKALLHSKEGLSGDAARELVVSVIRRHYHNYIERTKDD